LSGNIYTTNPITTNCTVTTSFAINTYAVTPSAGSGGTLSPSTAQTVNYNGTTSFTVTPNTGYSISSVTGCGGTLSGSTYTTGQITSNCTVTAAFAANSYTITASAGSNGTISPSGSVSANSGSTHQFTVTPKTSYTASVGGTCGGSLSGNTYTTNPITANCTVSASFAPTYTIAASANGNGSISPSGSVVVQKGSGQVFTITPVADYKISNVSVDGKWIGATSSYTFSDVASNHRITAHFAPIKLSITATTQSGGSISPTGTTSVLEGTNAAYTITPARQYILSDVLVDGKTYSEVSAGTLTSAVSGGTPSRAVTYTFTQVATDHTIHAVFSKIPAPVADAGPDQDVISGSVVTLDGSNSTDFVSGIASYRWTQTSGPHVNLSCPTAGPQCTFTAPQTSAATALAFNLAVTNQAGLTSTASSFVNVSTTDAVPVANTGVNQTVNPYTIVTLNGSGSSDPDGKIVSYKWVQIQGPSVTIYNANTPNASFVAPHPGSLGASLVFSLKVTDSFGLITRDQTTVNVINEYNPPIASAGPDQTAAPATIVTLDGSGSIDPVNSTDSYRWKQLRGVPVTLSDPTAISPTFTVPDDTDSQGNELVFMLTVTDAMDGLSGTAQCTVTIQPQ
jgi:hypothetical protein